MGRGRSRSRSGIDVGEHRERTFHARASVFFHRSIRFRTTRLPSSTLTQFAIRLFLGGPRHVSAVAGNLRQLLSSPAPTNVARVSLATSSPSAASASHILLTCEADSSGLLQAALSLRPIRAGRRSCYAALELTTSTWDRVSVRSRELESYIGSLRMSIKYVSSLTQASSVPLVARRGICHIVSISHDNSLCLRAAGSLTLHHRSLGDFDKSKTSGTIADVPTVG